MKIKRACVWEASRKAARGRYREGGSATQRVRERDFGLVATSLFHVRRNRSWNNRSPGSSSFPPEVDTMVSDNLGFSSSSSSSLVVLVCSACRFYIYVHVRVCVCALWSSFELISGVSTWMLKMCHSLSRSCFDGKVCVHWVARCATQGLRKNNILEGS